MHKAGHMRNLGQHGLGICSLPLGFIYVCYATFMTPRLQLTDLTIFLLLVVILQPRM